MQLVKSNYSLCTVSAKFVFDDDLHVFDNPTADTEQFIEGVTLCFDCFGKMIIEPPLYKLYPNKLYRDFKKGVMVCTLAHVCVACYACTKLLTSVDKGLRYEAC